MRSGEDVNENTTNWEELMKLLGRPTLMGLGASACRADKVAYRQRGVSRPAMLPAVDLRTSLLSIVRAPTWHQR
jgi:hypothetical protein